MKKLCVSVLLATGILAGAPAASLAVSAADADKDLYIESVETSISGNASLVMGAKKDLSGFIQYGVHDEDAGDQWYLIGNISWTSSNPDIVSIDSKGEATANRVGVSTITASAWDNMGRRHVQTITVGVTKSTQSTTNSFTLSSGDCLNLNELFFGGKENRADGDSIVWKSSNAGIASVDSNGLVQAKNAGSCTVTATRTGADKTVSVQRASIRVTDSTLSGNGKECSLILSEDTGVDISALLFSQYWNQPSTLKNMTVSTSDSNVADVNGWHITSKSTGSCKVKVYEGNGSGKTLAYTLSIRVTA